MLTRERLEEEIATIAVLADDLYTMIIQGEGRKSEFIRTLDDIEETCRVMRAEIIRHARQWGAGIRKNGKPDRRFRANRTQDSAKTDLRFSDD